MPIVRRPKDIDPQMLRSAQCDLDFACLNAEPGTFCNSDVFFDRDVKLIRCLDDRECRHKRRFGRMSICCCQVKHVQFS